MVKVVRHPCGAPTGENVGDLVTANASAGSRLRAIRKLLYGNMVERVRHGEGSTGRSSGGSFCRQRSGKRRVHGDSRRVARYRPAALRHPGHASR